MFCEVNAFSAGFVLVCWAFCPYCGHSLAGAAVAAAGTARPATMRASIVRYRKARKVPPNFVPSMTTSLSGHRWNAPGTKLKGKSDDPAEQPLGLIGAQPDERPG